MERAMDRLLAIMARLRDPDRGCPWDVEQTFATIAPHTIEEAYEVLDAIERADWNELKDELGDLLFQVVFHARMAEESGYFDFSDVVAAVCDKMVRRHPHIFGDAVVEDAAAQTRAWERHKARERAEKVKAGKGAPPGVLGGVSRALPALTRAVKLQKRAAAVGFDWPEARQVLDKIAEEIEEVRAEIDSDASAERLRDEVGDLMFGCVNLARKLGLDPEAALRSTNEKFESRFNLMEAALERRGQAPEDVTLEDMEALWVKAKAAANGADA